MPVPPKKHPKKKPERVSTIDEEIDAANAEIDDEDEVEDASGLLSIDGASIEAAVNKLMKQATFEPAQRYWLNTGHAGLNAVIGSPRLGVPYGKVVEFAGLEHAGKTLIMTILLGLAQQDGAAGGYIDLEDSRDEQWATKLGCYWPGVTKFYPQLITQKKGPPVLQSAEAIFESAEKAMYLLAKRGAEKQFWLIDSVANIVTAKQYTAGLTESTMNTRLDRAMFLSTMLPQWAGLAANYNALICVSNQLRAKIGTFVMGDPDETTGGRALRHACAIRCRVRRVKGGRLRQNKRIIGLAGCIRNVKNKAGEGSEEGHEIGFKIRWDKAKAKVEFMPLADLNDELGAKEEK